MQTIRSIRMSAARMLLEQLLGNRRYWEQLDEEMKSYAHANGLDYVRNDDSMNKPFDAAPVIVNFFYHEEIKKSVVKGNTANV